MQDHYSFKSETSCCSIFKNNVFYVRAPVRGGLFILDLDCNETHIHNIDAKRFKQSNDNSMNIWHCRLGHIGQDRVKRIHASGLFESLDIGSL